MIVYEKTLANKLTINNKELTAELNTAEVLKEAVNRKLENDEKELSTRIYIYAEELLNKAQEDFKVGNYLKTQIEVFNAKLVLLELLGS